jgi:hypothetical protein
MYIALFFYLKHNVSRLDSVSILKAETYSILLIIVFKIKKQDDWYCSKTQ